MTFDELLDASGKLLEAAEAIKVEFTKRAIEHELSRREALESDYPADAKIWAMRGDELRQALLIVEKYFPTQAT